MPPAWAPPAEPWAPEQTSKKSKRKNNKSSSAPPAEPAMHENGDPVTTFTWITLPHDAPLVNEGYPEIAPSLASEPGLQDLLSHSGSMLQDFVGDVQADVTLSDDGEWKTFPEVGEILTAEGFQELPMCIAACVSQCRWAVGLGSKWKQRENAAKLALCVALAADHPEAERLATEWPDLFKFCEDYMLDPDTPKKRTSMDSAVAWTAPEKPAKEEVDEVDDPDAEPKAKKQKTWVDDGVSLPSHAPLWLKLPDSEPTPAELEGLPGVALVVRTDGKAARGLYSQGGEALTKFCPDEASEVEYLDDFDWKKFPAVGMALKELAEKEECMCLAVCPSRVLWAVGVGMKGKERLRAAKVAMAAALALQGTELDTELPDLEGMDVFMEFVDEARALEKPFE
mmetsp:Transcript_95242/g.164512  ORF Transcript_95242/g.164512 Transcript_95242/m.164512 type:complete len:397 (+) Transcript_95242:2-1192(+)